MPSSSTTDGAADADDVINAGGTYIDPSSDTAGGVGSLPGTGVPAGATFDGNSVPLMEENSSEVSVGVPAASLRTTTTASMTTVASSMDDISNITPSPQRSARPASATNIISNIVSNENIIVASLRQEQRRRRSSSTAGAGGGATSAPVVAIEPRTSTSTFVSSRRQVRSGSSSLSSSSFIVGSSGSAASMNQLKWQNVMMKESTSKHGQGPRCRPRLYGRDTAVNDLTKLLIDTVTTQEEQNEKEEDGTPAGSAAAAAARTPKKKEKEKKALPKQALAVIHGLSGCGKTELVRSVMLKADIAMSTNVGATPSKSTSSSTTTTTAKQQSWWYGETKFDEQQRGMRSSYDSASSSSSPTPTIKIPYDGIRSVLDDIILQQVQGDGGEGEVSCTDEVGKPGTVRHNDHVDNDQRRPERQERQQQHRSSNPTLVLAERLLKELDRTELSFLTQLLPGLRDVIDLDRRSGDIGGDGTSNDAAVQETASLAVERRGRTTRTDHETEPTKTQTTKKKMENSTKNYDSTIGVDDLADECGRIGPSNHSHIDTNIENNSSGGNNGTSAAAGDAQANAHRLKHCVKRFVQVLGSICPIVLFLDDVQWIDDVSLDILFNLLSDRSVPLFAIIAYRTNEVHVDGADSITKNGETKGNEGEVGRGQHVVTKFIQSVRSSNNDGHSISVQEHEVKNLSVQDVNTFLGDLLSCEKPETLDLATVIHTKTGGNIFFVIQLMKVLSGNRTISYSLGLMKWTWDVDEIEDTPSTDNVVELVQHKLSLNPEIRQILPIAAFLGTTFEESTLSIIARELTDVAFKDEDIDRLLKRTETEGFIIQTRSGAYSFIHDRIREGAIAILPSEVQGRRRYEVGSILAAFVLSQRNGIIDGLIFTTVSLLRAGFDAGHGGTDEEMYRFVDLCLTAAKKAVNFAAFQVAADYLQSAIQRLPQQAWQERYDMSIDLVACAAEAALCIGDNDKVFEMYSMIVNKPIVPPADKLRVTITYMDSLIAQSKAQESIDTALDILAENGCKLPRNGFRVGISNLWGMMRAKSSKNLQSADHILALPINQSVQHSLIMKVLDRIATSTFHCNPAYLPTPILKSLELTLKHGITRYSPVAFALMGLLLTNFMDDLAAGYSMARNALLILKRLTVKENEARTMFLCYNFSIAWSRPIHDVMKPFMKAYRIGLGTGDVPSAMYSIFFYSDASICVGTDLAIVNDNIERFSVQMEEVGQDHTLIGLKILHQMVRLWRGIDVCDTMATMTGEIMDQDEAIQGFKDRQDDMYMAALHRYRTILACYLGDFEVGAYTALDWTECAVQRLPGHFIIPIHRFCSAMCCFAAAWDATSRKQKKKFLKLARRNFKIVKDWAERKLNNPNCVHRAMLLSAEAMAIDGKKNAVGLYESAVLMAGRRGATHDQALANERLSSYCFYRDDVDESNYRLREAIRLYSEWGAMSKVQRLQQRLHHQQYGDGANENPLIGTTIAY